RGLPGGYLASIKLPLDQSPALVAGLGPLSAVTLGRFFRYDAAGAVTGESDGRGHARTYQRDGFGLLTRELDEMGNARAMTYDADLNLVALDEDLSPGTARHTALFRDVEGKLIGRCGELEPGACAGDLASLTAGRGTNLGAALTTWDYDGEGRLTQITDPESHTTLIGWDWRDLPLAVVRGAEGQPEYTTYAYDAARRPTRI